MNKHYNRVTPGRLAWPGWVAVIAALLLPGAPVMAETNQLRSIDFTVLPGNQVEIRMEMEHPVAEPRSFTIRDPARIALDFPGTRNATGSRSLPIDAGIARSLDLAETADRTRVVINLTELPSFRTRVEGSTVLLTLGDTGAPVARAEPGDLPATEPFQAREPEPATAADSGQRGVRNVDFRRGVDGQGRVIVTLTDPDVPVTIDRDGRDIIINMANTQIPEALRERLDVLDFATPVQYVDIMQRARDGRIVIRPRTADFDQIAYQSDNVFTVELQPLTREEIADREREEPEYTGDQLSLNFQDIEVRSVLQLLADFTNLNVVVSDSVTGNLTLRLRNVPWDQALDIILETKGLGKRRSGNVIYVAPAQEIAQREQERLESQRQQEELAPLRNEYIQVNYARASDLASLLRSDDANLLSDRANISVDSRTNTLLIQDTHQHLEEARRLINRLDIPVRQVQIESRIVVATDDFNRELGVRFGATRDTTARGTDSGFATSGGVTATTEILNNDEISTDRFNVNLPVASPSGAISLALAKLPLGTLLELELSAMQAEGRGEIISSPRVITSNQREARIEQGVEIPYQEASASGATAVSFRSAVLSLTVTPQITPDDRIIMDLRVTRDSVGQVFAGVPSIDTRAVETQVLVDDGETVVLGGIYEQVTNDQVERVPFFGDLPLVGRLFRNTLKQDEKSELLVFVTPKIIRGIDDVSR